MTVLIQRDEDKTITYIGTGAQEEILFDKSDGYPRMGTVRVTGGSSDVFALKTKTGDTYRTEIDSVDGIIPPLPIFSKGKGLTVDITDNVSGAIKIEVLL